MKISRSLCTWTRCGLITLCLTGFSFTTIAAEYLGTEDVNQLISGNTVDAKNIKRGTTSITFFQPDGTFRQLLDGKPGKGTWSVETDGSLCTNREGWGSGCRKISKDGDTWKLYKIPKNTMKSREHKKTYTRIRTGNPDNL